MSRNGQFPQRQPARAGDGVLAAVGRRDGLPDKQEISRPLPGSGESNRDGKHGVLVGGESGAGARPMRKEGVLSIRNQCEKAKVPFFFKQWSGVRKRKAGRDLEGKKYDSVPRRLELPVLDNTRRLAAMAAIGRLDAPTLSATEPGLFAAPG